MSTELRLIKISKVIEKTALSRSSIYDYMSKGLFPNSVKLGARSVAWVESEVDAWILGLNRS
ncbi:AlpA family transcriptional regulator [Pseudoalteromonas sp. SS15]|mgnify:CR=1 FL=1|jgi:prophage regulatory protein|uniref:AlpA family transcriptional regulator n=1 Tax=Pseudoalteromonas sp. SS15 TaxID=3139393 RepID=UPI000C0ADDA4|nr:transcriptional regulator [Pseudoalteromonas sp.]|tara:strand:- start:741 stop:926 length:186 start_codon:yes stop_codon:yes gene_type:complete